jgi:hypothetical protein
MWSVTKHDVVFKSEGLQNCNDLSTNSPTKPFHLHSRHSLLEPSMGREALGVWDYVAGLEDISTGHGAIVVLHQHLGLPAFELALLLHACQYIVHLLIISGLVVVNADDMYIMAARGIAQYTI